MTTLRPTLADLCADWFAYGLSPKRAVHDLIALHLRHGEAKGSGNRAKRRINTICLGNRTIEFGNWRIESRDFPNLPK